MLTEFRRRDRRGTTGLGELDRHPYLRHIRVLRCAGRFQPERLGIGHCMREVIDLPARDPGSLQALLPAAGRAPRTFSSMPTSSVRFATLAELVVNRASSAMPTSPRASVSMRNWSSLPTATASSASSHCNVS